MKYFVTNVNPLGELLNHFPEQTTNFTVTMFMDFMKTLSLGGWFVETEIECYQCLKELESMKLISIVWDIHDRPLSIRRLVRL